MPKAIKAPDTGGQEIRPDSLYPLPGFLRVARIGYTFRARARAAGIELKTIKSGRNVYVRGSDGIAFLEAVAELDASSNGD